MVLDEGFTDRVLKHSEKDSATNKLREADGDFLVNYKPAMFENFGTVTPRNKNQDALYNFAVREDTNPPKVLGLHGSGYSQQESYHFLTKKADELFPDSTVNCTIFNQGERCMLVQNIGDEVDLGDGDVIRPNIAWTASFNGTWSTAVYDFSSRVFCSNMLNMGKAIFKVRRTESHNDSLEERSMIIKSSMDRFATLTTIARVLKDNEFTDDQFFGLMSEVLPEPKSKTIKDSDGFHFIEPPHPQAIRHYVERSTSMLEAWEKEKERWGQGNRWLAYNAIQGAEQHYINAGYNPRRIKNQHKALVKAVEGKTRLADKAMAILSKG
jgi:hypothetical protein